jgi:putative ABC transport system substrate-binding protein
VNTPKRTLLLGLLSALPALSLSQALWAQARPALPRVAYVFIFKWGPSAPFEEAFRERLAELGWVPGKNFQFEVRDAQGSPEKLAAIMQELVTTGVDVIVGACTPEGRAAAKLTSTIPIVMAATGDPVKAGLADSLAHPGRNVTGVSAMLLELSAKRLELLKEAFPAVVKATVIWNPERPDNAPEVAAMQVAATRLGVVLESRQVRSPGEMRDLLDVMSPGSTQAILNAGDTLLSSQAPVLVNYCNKLGLPSLFENREYPDAGALMSYGPNFPALHRRAADYVDKILRGTKPANMPFEQPTRFELVINLKTAKALGFALPNSLLLRADALIE